MTPPIPRSCKHIRLDLVSLEDAELIVELRSGEAGQRFLSASAMDAASQRAWLVDYKQREDRGEEFYYRINDNVTGEAYGLLRIYDIVPGGSFQWGSWIVRPGAPIWAGLESWLQVHEIGFCQMGCHSVEVRTSVDNATIHKFLEAFGFSHLRTENGHHYASCDDVTFFQAAQRYKRCYAQGA